MDLKTSWRALKSAVEDFNADNILTQAAALTYYAIFSLGPILAIALGLAGLAFGKDSARHQIHQALTGMVGPMAAQTVDSMIGARSHGTSLATMIVGLVALLFGALGVFSQLQSALNIIWKVKPKPKAGWGAFLRHRILSLSMLMAICFLLLVSLAISTALAALSGRLNQAIPFGSAFGHGLDVAVSFAVLTVLFSMIFKFMPDAQIPWRRIWVGGFATALLFSVGKALLGWYLGKQSTASAYGAAGSVIVILMWVYYASLIVLFGAEFARACALAAGHKPKPKSFAELSHQGEQPKPDPSPSKKGKSSFRPQQA